MNGRTRIGISGPARAEQPRRRRGDHPRQGPRHRRLRPGLLIGIELLTIDARIVVERRHLPAVRGGDQPARRERQGRHNPADLLTEGVGEVTEKVASTEVERKVQRVVEPVKGAVGGAVEKVVDAAEDVAHEVADTGGAWSRRCFPTSRGPAECRGPFPPVGWPYAVAGPSSRPRADGAGSRGNGAGGPRVVGLGHPERGGDVGSDGRVEPCGVVVAWSRVPQLGGVGRRTARLLGLTRAAAAGSLGAGRCGRAQLDRVHTDGRLLA